MKTSRCPWETCQLKYTIHGGHFTLFLSVKEVQVLSLANCLHCYVLLRKLQSLIKRIVGGLIKYEQ